ncbi:MAG: GTP 3',8-cyclase MoaA [Caulobacteraceae bacterium]
MAFDAAPISVPALTDPFGRTISYLRVSVTDRCDLRCAYCMAERMTFLPRAEVLSLEELDRLASVFVDLGVRKLRLTGGEPLVRKNILWLVERLSRHLGHGLDELTLTTNATRLALFTDDLARLGVKRINVSLDSIDPETYWRVTRGGDLAQTLGGIEAAARAGVKIKINTVALKDTNEAELPALIQWAHGQGFDLSLIEVMPLGETGEDRRDQFLSLAEVRERLAAFWTLSDLPDCSGGPARYVRVAETGGRLGFITPLTHNFCGDCNRVRLTCTGTLHACLGQSDAADLRGLMRSGADNAALAQAVRDAIAVKPRAHDFDTARLNQPALARHMSVTGG